MFSQVDVLTINQFFEIFGTRLFVLTSFINQTDVRYSKMEESLGLVFFIFI